MVALASEWRPGPAQVAAEVALHESAHCAEAWLQGLEVSEIDCDHVRGHTIHSSPGPLLFPMDSEQMGDAAAGWAEAAIFRRAIDAAMISRVGALVGRQDWLSYAVRNDRAKVQSRCPYRWKVELWDLYITYLAEQRVEMPDFRAVQIAIYRELERTHYAILRTDRIHEIATAALAEIGAERVVRA